MKFEMSFAGKRVTAHIHHHARDALVLRIIHHIAP
jgi:hypothetical protein